MEVIPRRVFVASATAWRTASSQLSPDSASSSTTFTTAMASLPAGLLGAGPRTLRTRRRTGQRKPRRRSDAGGQDRARPTRARHRGPKPPRRATDATRWRHTPDELELPFALWSRAAVRELIRRRFRVRLAVRTMGTYLARWGFTAQKPLRR